MGENNIQNKIEKKFLFYDTRAAFNTDFNTGKIKDESIVFVKDDQTIWTHGQEFKANGNSLKLLIDSISTKVEQVNTATQQLIDNKITQVLANIDQSHAQALEDAAASLAQAKLDLDAVQERMEALIASGLSAQDYAIKLEGIIKLFDDSIGEINAGIATLTAFMDFANAKFGLMLTAENIATQSETIYTHIVDLIGQQIKLELRIIDTDQDVVNAVGRIMLSGFLQDYVTTTLLTDAGYLSLLALLLLSTENGTALASLAASVERLNEQVSSFVTAYASLDSLNLLKDLLGGGTLQGFENILAAWLAAIEENGILKGYLVQYLTSDGDVYTQLKTDVFSILNLEGSPVLLLNNRLNDLELAEGYTLTIGKINDLLDNSVLLSLNGITIKGSNGNKIQLVSKTGNEQFGGLRHWIDLNNNDSWYDTVTSGGKPYTELKTSNFELNVDGSGHVGRYTSYTYTENGLTTTEEAFPISWGTDGKVKIFADVIGDAQGNPIEWDTPSYKTEYIFTKINNSNIPSELSSLLPSNNDDPNANGEYAVQYGLNVCTWQKTAISGSVGFSVFIALRENLVNKNGDITLKGSWQGPYQISGADGGTGTDADGIHFIYKRTNNNTAPTVTGVTSNSLGGWSESASDLNVLINKDNRFCWMAFSTEKNSSEVWINFQGPILWSVWGEQGVDGDGVEYIFCITTAYKDWDNENTNLNPSNWLIDQDDEYIHDDYKGSTLGNVNKWYDDPLKMSDGMYQWVSKRTYTYNALAGKKQWGAYSVPSLWSYYAQDGVVSGYTINIDNQSIALSVNSHGHLATEDEGDVPNVNHQIYWNIHKTDGTQPVYTSDIYNYSGTISSSAPVYTIGYTAEAVPAASNSHAPSWHRVTIEGSGNDVYANLELVSYFDVITWDSNDQNEPYRDTGIDHSNLNLLNNNVKVTLTFTVFEAYDPSDHSNDVKYTFTKTFYVYGVYTGNDGEAGTTFDLKVSSVTVSKNRYSGAVSPSSITVWCLKTKGDVFEKIYPSSTNNTSAIRFGYYRGNNAPSNPGIGDIASLTTNSISTNDTLPIVVYMFLKKDGVYTMIDLLEITEVLSGENGAGTYVSTVFCRTSIDEVYNASPNTPTGGSYSTHIPNPAGVTYDNGSEDVAVYPLVKDNEGNYGFSAGANQVEWQDGIPEGDETLWESRCIFTSTSPDIANWTPPRKVQDSIDWDVEFALELAGGATPGAPTNENRHGGSGTLIWYDPDLDKNTVLPNSATWKDMVWRAERWKFNGIYTDWTIVRIKGEQGDSKFTSMIFTRTNTTPIAPNYTSSDFESVAQEDVPATYNTPVPQGKYAWVKDSNGWVEVRNSEHKVWTDGIPEGGEMLWACTREFSHDVEETVWKDPKPMTDTETWDVEFSDSESYPDEPIYQEEASNINDNTTWNTFGSSNQIWYDPQETLPSGKSWTDMIWRAERSIKNGEAGEWTILKIKGEQGDPSNGYNFKGSSNEIHYTYGMFGELLDEVYPVITFTLTVGDEDVSSWTLQGSYYDNDNHITTISNESWITLSSGAATIGEVPDGVRFIKFEAVVDNNTVGYWDVYIYNTAIVNYRAALSESSISYNAGATNKWSPSTINVILEQYNYITKRWSLLLQISSPWGISVSAGFYSNITNGVITIDQNAGYGSFASGVNIVVTYDSSDVFNFTLPVNYVAKPDDPEYLPKYTLTISNVDAKYYVDGNRLTVTSFGNPVLTEAKSGTITSPYYVIEKRIPGYNNGNIINSEVTSIDATTPSGPTHIEYIAYGMVNSSGRLVAYTSNIDVTRVVLAYVYIPVTIYPKDGVTTTNTTYEYVGLALGDPGKMFYMQGEYNPTNTYTSDTITIPVVYFHEHGEEKGCWWYLKGESNVNNGVHYAPGITSYNSSEGKVYDNYARGFRASVTDNANDYWEKADRFNIVISDAIFADFAKVGSAIISGDYMISQHGTINGLLYGTGATVGKRNTTDTIKVPAYTKFAPVKDIDETVVNETLTHNHNATIGPSFIIPEGCEMYGTIEIKCSSSLNENCKLFLKPLKDGAMYVGEGGEDIDLATGYPNTNNEKCYITSQSYDSATQVYTWQVDTYGKVIDKQRPYIFYFLNKSGSSVVYSVNIDLHIYKTGPSGTLLEYGVFEPNWCVDLRTGKMIAGAGNFVVESDGAISAAGGNMKVATDGTITIGNNSSIVANANGSISAAGGKFVIDVNGNLYISGKQADNSEIEISKSAIKQKISYYTSSHTSGGSANFTFKTQNNNGLLTEEQLYYNNTSNTYSAEYTEGTVACAPLADCIICYYITYFDDPIATIMLPGADQMKGRTVHIYIQRRGNGNASKIKLDSVDLRICNTIFDGSWDPEIDQELYITELTSIYISDANGYRGSVGWYWTKLT